jgi:hypothetical protein
VTFADFGRLALLENQTPALSQARTTLPPPVPAKVHSIYRQRIDMHAIKTIVMLPPGDFKPEALARVINPVKTKEDFLIRSSNSWAPAYAKPLFGCRLGSSLSQTAYFPNIHAENVNTYVCESGK